MTIKGLSYSPKRAGVVTPGAFSFLRLDMQPNWPQQGRSSRRTSVQRKVVRHCVLLLPEPCRDVRGGGETSAPAIQLEGVDRQTSALVCLAERILRRIPQSASELSTADRRTQCTHQALLEVIESRRRHRSRSGSCDRVRRR